MKTCAALLFPFVVSIGISASSFDTLEKFFTFLIWGNMKTDFSSEEQDSASIRQTFGVSGIQQLIFLLGKQQ